MYLELSIQQDKQLETMRRQTQNCDKIFGFVQLVYEKIGVTQVKIGDILLNCDKEKII